MNKAQVQGFVLAGGKSARMGVDKATLMMRGRALVEIAVGKLRTVCGSVAIVGNRDDLKGFAAVVGEARLDTGPGAGMEAGLLAASAEWCLFLPVDVPLLPAQVLRGWAEDTLKASQAGIRASYVVANGKAQPLICMLHKDCAAVVTAALDGGERRVTGLLDAVGKAFGSGAVVAREIGGGDLMEGDAERWVFNVNRPEDLVVVERLAKG